MAGAGAGAEPGPGDAEAPGAAPEDLRDWAGLPQDLLVKVARTLVAQSEAGWAAKLKEWGNSEEVIQYLMAERKRDGLGLFVFARVCKPWRKAQLMVGGPLRTRVKSDVLLPGSVTLAKWALAEGCPRDDGVYWTMARAAAQYGYRELVQWLCGEGGFAMNEWVMNSAAVSGNMQLVKWLRGEGCPWNSYACYNAVQQGHVEVLRWARENGAPWNADIRDRAARKLGYTDNLPDTP